MSSDNERRVDETGTRTGKRRAVGKRTARPHSRIVTVETYPDVQITSRLSRSHTMMSPAGLSPDVQTLSKSRSPTFTGQFSPKYSPKRSHGSFDNGDLAARGIQSSSQTLSQLHRSHTTKLGAGVYGKNMWDDDEYVDTGGGTAPKTPTGGAAARRINQQRKAQAQTVKLPNNPFIDGDYADMTGHQRNEGGMEELRSTHQYKSMKARSQSTSRFPIETETDGIVRHPSDADLSTRDRNLSTSSSGSGSQTWRFKRSDTSPAFRSQGSIKEKYADVQRNESLRGVQPVIEEESNQRSPPATLPLSNSDDSGRTVPLDRQSSLVKPTTAIARAQNSSLAPSPSHSGISTETQSTFLKQSVTASPVVMYKSNGFDNGTENAQVAIVVDEIKPKSPMYGSFANNSQKSDDKSTLKFDASPPRRKKKTLCLIMLAVLLVLGLLATIAALAAIVIQQNEEIQSLEKQINSFQGKITTDSPLSSEPSEIREKSTTEHVTVVTSQPIQSTTMKTFFPTTIQKLDSTVNEVNIATTKTTVAPSNSTTVMPVSQSRGSEGTSAADITPPTTALTSTTSGHPTTDLVTRESATIAAASSQSNAVAQTSSKASSNAPTTGPITINRTIAAITESTSIPEESSAVSANTTTT